MTLAKILVYNPEDKFTWKEGDIELVSVPTEYDLYVERAIGGLHIVKESITLEEGISIGTQHHDILQKYVPFDFVKEAIQFSIRRRDTGEIVYRIGSI